MTYNFPDFVIRPPESGQLFQSANTGERFFVCDVTFPDDDDDPPGFFLAEICEEKDREDMQAPTMEFSPEEWLDFVMTRRLNPVHP